ncbi:MAG: hypothetical protein R3B70_32690 [Polyangiaceae bacterium]
MESHEPTALVEGSTVTVLRAGTRVGSCRFEGDRLVQYDGAPLGETDAAHGAALDALAVRLLAQGRDELLAMQRASHDAEGVDLSLIRWMLTLTPLQRLQHLEAQSRFFALGRAALRQKGVRIPQRVE